MSVALPLLVPVPGVRTLLLGAGCWVVVSVLAAALYAWLMWRSREPCDNEEDGPG